MGGLGMVVLGIRGFMDGGGVQSGGGIVLRERVWGSGDLGWEGIGAGAHEYPQLICIILLCYKIVHQMQDNTCPEHRTDLQIFLALSVIVCP